MSKSQVTPELTRALVAVRKERQALSRIARVLLQEKLFGADLREIGPAVESEIKAILFAEITIHKDRVRVNLGK